MDRDRVTNPGGGLLQTGETFFILDNSQNAIFQSQTDFVEGDVLLADLYDEVKVVATGRSARTHYIYLNGLLQTMRLPEFQ